MAKTPAAESLAAVMAKGLQLSDDEDEDDKACYYLKVGTVESIKKVGTHLVENVLLVFDDVTPSERRGTRASMTWNELKHVTYVVKSGEGTEAIDARYDDIVIPPNCPRVFTSNALTPSGWMHGLVDACALSDAELKAALCNNTLYVDSAAIYKRCVFAHVTECLIPPEKRKRYENTCMASVSAKVARFL